MKKYIVGVSLVLGVAVFVFLALRHNEEQGRSSQSSDRIQKAQPTGRPQAVAPRRPQIQSSDDCKINVTAEDESGGSLSSFFACGVDRSGKPTHCVTSDVGMPVEVKCDGASEIMVTAPGHLGARQNVKSQTAVLLRLRSGATAIEGAVFDSFGGAVPSAMVWNRWAVTQADDTGKFRLWAPKGVEGKLTARHDSYEALEMIVSAPRKGIEIRLFPQLGTPRSTLNVELLTEDEQGRALHGCSASGYRGTGASPEPGRVLLDARKGLGTFKVTCPDYAQTTIEIEIAVDMAPVEVVLAGPSGRVTGTVVDTDGEALPAGTVAACWSDDECVEAEVDIFGHYALAEVASGTPVRVTAYVQGFTEVPAREVVVPPGEEAVVDFQADTGHRIFGTVDGARGSIAYVKVRSLSNLVAKSVRVNDEGAFEVTGLEAGEYEVRATRSAGLNQTDDAEVETVSAESEQAIQLSLEGLNGEVAGVVIDKDGTGVEGVLVTARVGPSDFLPVTESDPAGEFRIAAPAGAQAYVIAKDMSGATGSVRVKVGADSKSLVVRLGE